MAFSAADYAALFRPMVVDPDSDRRAVVENMLFEERLSPARLDSYGRFAAGSLGYEGWLEQHTDYLNEAVIRHDLPETFSAANAGAALPAAVRPDQYLIRVESLAYVFESRLVSGVDDLDDCLTRYRSGTDAELEGAKAALGKVCQSLNDNPNAQRPRFAAFEEELAEDVARPDWANRLRDRLGLGHLPSTTHTGPLPIALMRYTVAEVYRRTNKLGGAHALTAPMQMDQEVNAIFHPSPKTCDWGRTLNLAGDSDCAALASEVLHPRIDYAPSHIWKVGAITGRADTAPARIMELRNQHLFCLQYLSEREDFGKL